MGDSVAIAVTGSLIFAVLIWVARQIGHIRKSVERTDLLVHPHFAVNGEESLPTRVARLELNLESHTVAEEVIQRNFNALVERDMAERRDRQVEVDGQLTALHRRVDEVHELIRREA